MGEVLEDNRVITNRQYGFRQGNSCVTNILSFYTRVIEGIDNREAWVDTVFLDIKKAFDRIPHKRLMETEVHRITERKSIGMDARLFEG